MSQSTTSADGRKATFYRSNRSLTACSCARLDGPSMQRSWQWQTHRVLGHSARSTSVDSFATARVSCSAFKLLRQPTNDIRRAFVNTSRQLNTAIGRTMDIWIINQRSMDEHIKQKPKVNCRSRKLHSQKTKLWICRHIEVLTLMVSAESRIMSSTYC